MKTKNKTKMAAKADNNLKIFIDCGGNGGTYYDGNKERKAVAIPSKEILNLPNTLAKGSIIYGERAHFGVPRTEFSRAQYFTAEELSKFYKDCIDNSVQFKMYSERIMPFMLKKANLKKSDFNDPVAAYEYITSHPNIENTLMNPPNSFEEDVLRQEGHEFKKELDLHLNQVRGNKHKNYNHPNMHFIEDHINEIADELSESAKEAFDIKWSKKKNCYDHKKMSRPVAYTIFALFRDYDQNPVHRDNPTFQTKQAPGWNFIKKYVIQSSPFHFKGGIARSNVYHHGCKSYINKQFKDKYGFTVKKSKPQSEPKTPYKLREDLNNEEEAFFNKTRNLYCNTYCRELFFAYKKILAKYNK